MNLVVTGTGKSGSWRIRGDQLGAAVGAKVLPRCTDFRACALAVYVKRVSIEALVALRKANIRWVWDIVDAWPQPEGNTWGTDQAVSWLRGQLQRLQPYAVVFTTKAMQEDSGWEGPSIVLPHHAWPRYDRRNDLRPEVRVLGYEGNDYLGGWEGQLRRECQSRGWRLEMNGPMRNCDIGIALREAEGHPARRWKSNVKLANLQALGVPALCSPEAGYLEFSHGAEVLVDSPERLSDALDWCALDEVRLLAQTVEIITLQQVAKDYRAWLRTLNS